ncbi:unnamed protein product [Arctogadus glacialis]
MLDIRQIFGHSFPMENCFLLNSFPASELWDPETPDQCRPTQSHSENIKYRLLAKALERRWLTGKVNFDNFDGILSFVHVNKNHWNMLYIHAKSGTVYQMDPSPASSELEDSTHAAQRLQEYLKIRKHQGKTDWVDVKWRGGVMPHPVQMDGCSCGVIVVEMARAVMEAFPEFPKMNFSTKRRAMEEARRDMALQVLESSVFDEETCSMCGADKPPGQAPPITDWIQCDNCDRWFHNLCLNMDQNKLKEVKKRQWLCVLCR